MEKNDQELLVISTSEDAANKKKNIISTANNSNKKGSSSNSSSSYCSPIIRSCQADKCSVDLSDAKQYHKRHKVCEYHAKSQVVVVAGLRQRFCQQCSRFHEVTEFDESKRSCRRRLAGHNERRRKSISSLSSSSSSADYHQTHNNNNKDDMNMMFGDKGRIHISIPQNFHLR